MTLDLVLTACFTALGVAIAPFFYFPFLGTRAFPGQHLINALTGVILGPWWGALVAASIGVVRNLLGIGTVFAFPGGIPGALVVGLAHKAMGRLGRGRIRYAAALLEPLGTVLIGATLSLFLIAPIIGWKPLLSLIEGLGPLPALLALWFGWSISSVIGSAMGYIALLILDRAGLMGKLPKSP
ncbi:MAG: energy coupling factor transporter S component ThiW [Candidatus Bathyarchaeia archaeon]